VCCPAEGGCWLCAMLDWTGLESDGQLLCAPSGHLPHPERQRTRQRSRGLSDLGPELAQTREDEGSAASGYRLQLGEHISPGRVEGRCSKIGVRCEICIHQTGGIVVMRRETACGAPVRRSTVQISILSGRPQLDLVIPVGTHPPTAG
jgi:hypothetical protein